MFWFMQGLCFLPVFLVIWSSCTFIVSYLIALFRHDVDVIFPYISDTGANPPESCIFGLMTFISACAGTATIYARYKFVEKLNEDTRVVKPKLNKAALTLGILSCFGMCVVATFQETAVTVVHDIGAFMFFFCGILYIILQSVISFQAHPYGSSICLCRWRAIIGAIAVAAFFPTVICAYFVKQTVLHRHTDDKDYPFHVASAVCEWVVAFSFVCFFLTYIDDFKLFTLRVETECEE
ncbi:DNA damage-regulated autophagy modulator protein 1 [Parambassis ranga]|uniref:DNA damage-regulated autophagy modulator protein 1 n=1 Tax=Parambassis ranga TaxID=210632 RepID=A0A6P7I2R7_9TELE|nr:DNA damage-regulated autophagy modulator protein 1 [Parambassis ranga]XP_028254949.1 DNA damage-regulated autophagy modulator protein 1 [Parambassis ranga]